MARRNSEVELCFDSMTDLITNLAGGLILVVMLLLGLTREAPKTLETRPGSVGKQTTGEKPTNELVRRLNHLQVDTIRVDAEISADEQLLRELDRKATELLDSIKKSGKSPSDSPAKK